MISLFLCVFWLTTPGANVQVTADKIGLGIVGVTAAGVLAHALGKEVKKAVTRKKSPTPEEKGERIKGI